MSVCRQSHTVYSDIYDLDGVLNVVGREIKDGGSEFLMGVYAAVFVFRYEKAENQAIFLDLVRNLYREQFGGEL